MTNKEILDDMSKFEDAYKDSGFEFLKCSSCWNDVKYIHEHIQCMFEGFQKGLQYNTANKGSWHVKDFADGWISFGDDAEAALNKAKDTGLIKEFKQRSK